MPGRLNRRHVQLAADRKWAKVYAQLDRSRAGLNTFDEVRDRRVPRLRAARLAGFSRVAQDRTLESV